MMPREFAEFVLDLQADGLPEETCERIEEAMREFGEECGDDPSKIDLLDAYRWVLRHRNRLPIEKMIALAKINQRCFASQRAGERRVVFNLPEVTGWR